MTQQLTSMNAATWKMQVINQLRSERALPDVERGVTKERILMLEEKKLEAEAKEVAPLITQKKLKGLGQLILKKYVALFTVLRNMSVTYQLANSDARFAQNDVSTWFNQNFLRQDARVLNSL